MAVQAQYPSNALVLDRNEQEKKKKNMDYPFHAQATGLFDQSTILFANGGGMSNNNRKRGREVIPGTTRRLNPINNLISSTSPQQPSSSPNPPHLLNQLPQPSLVSTGLRLSIESQQQQQQKPTLPLLSSSLTEELTAQINYQKSEIDQLLHAQEEQLKQTLAYNRQRHYRSLMRLAEESAAKRLNEKEAEVEKAARRNAELEERVARLRAESMTWQAKARAEEAAAAVLQAQLQHVAAGRQQHQERGEEPTGCAGDLAAEDAESVYIDPERRVEASVAGAVACRACRWRPVSVVLLPCRHLCLCRDCDGDGAVDACPVCLCVRSASVQVYLC